MDILEKANKFQQLHQGDCFVMANAWSAGSAVLLEQKGFAAIGTSSAGIAFNHALADASLPFEVALQDTAEIVADLTGSWRAASLPLTSVNDDKLGRFPITTVAPGREVDLAPTSGPLLLYRLLDGGEDVGNRLRVVAGTAGDVVIEF